MPVFYDSHFVSIHLLASLHFSPSLSSFFLIFIFFWLWRHIQNIISYDKKWSEPKYLTVSDWKVDQVSRSKRCVICILSQNINFLVWIWINENIFIKVLMNWKLYIENDDYFSNILFYKLFIYNPFHKIWICYSINNPFMIKSWRSIFIAWHLQTHTNNFSFAWKRKSCL